MWPQGQTCPVIDEHVTELVSGTPSRWRLTGPSISICIGGPASRPSRRYLRRLRRPRRLRGELLRRVSLNALERHYARRQGGQCRSAPAAQSRPRSRAAQHPSGVSNPGQVNADDSAEVRLSLCVWPSAGMGSRPPGNPVVCSPPPRSMADPTDNPSSLRADPELTSPKL